MYFVMHVELLLPVNITNLIATTITSTMIMLTTIPTTIPAIAPADNSSLEALTAGGFVGLDIGVVNCLTGTIISSSTVRNKHD